MDFNSILRAAARRDFWAFCVYMNADFFKKRPFLYAVAVIFQKVIDKYSIGIAIKVKVSMPPRAGKSYITSLFAAYWLGVFNELSVMRNTCTARLYEKFSYDTRAIIRSERYRQVFPLSELADDKQNLTGWNLKTSKQVAYFGAGVGGTIIGFGANLAISDDLYKDMKDALSSITIENVEMWKESAHDSRMEKNCPEIYIGTRWSTKDVIGKAECDYSVTIPALIEKDGEMVSFCEDVKSTQEYLTIREKIDLSIWLAEYMQDPKEIKGLLIPLSTLQTAKREQFMTLPTAWNVVVVDPADKGGDNFAAVFIRVIVESGKLNAYVSDVIYSTHGVEVNSARVNEKMKQNSSEQVIVEVNGLGVAAAINIKRDLSQNAKLTPINSTQAKDVRIASNYEFVQRHFIFTAGYETNQEFNRFISDLTNYVEGADNTHRKDAIDVCCLAASFIKIKFAKYLYG